MPYIVINENEIVKAEMAVPDCWGWSGPNPMECKKCIKFQDHCLSLPRIPAPGHKWKLWSEVVEGKDFRLEKQFLNENDEWQGIHFFASLTKKINLLTNDNTHEKI